MQHNELKKILIADDDTLFADSLESIFADKGYEIKRLSTGEKVLETIFSWKPDITLLDIMMPGKNGIDIIKEIHKDHSDYTKHVIIMTSMDGTSYLAEALEYGVKSYIAKTTVTPEYILDMVEAKYHELNNH